MIAFERRPIFAIPPPEVCGERRTYSCRNYLRGHMGKIASENGTIVCKYQLKKHCSMAKCFPFNQKGAVRQTSD